WAASSSRLAKAVRNHLTRIVLPLPGQPRDFIVTREVARIGLGQGRFDLGNLPLVVLDELPNGFRGEEGLAALGGRREAVEAILHLVIEADGHGRGHEDADSEGRALQSIVYIVLQYARFEGASSWQNIVW